MYSLVLDTSTERGVVAIVREGEIVFIDELPFGLQNSQHLLPALDRGIKQSGLHWRDLSLIAVAVGPGSYTGIRVGAMVAKTLSFAWGIPLVGVCTLDGFVPEEAGDYAVVIDAKISGVYIQKNRLAKEGIQPILPPRLCLLSEGAAWLEGCTQIVSPNFLHLRPKLEMHLSSNAHSWLECYPSVLHLAAIASHKLCQQTFTLDGRLELLYMRQTQAEIEKVNRKLDLD